MDRVIIFLLACVPARILFALTAYLWKSPLLALPAIAIAAGLLYNLIVRRPARGGFGGIVWWNEARAVHAALLIAFATMRLRRMRGAWRLLVADAGLALLAHALLSR